ncbi:glycosyltransferase family 2 protein [Rhodophyticola sp. CCM32]|uniref:glycosyltransferase family 2 protein n=1 Tax=Rhodophyticola sp. CCM32 TaxID=2916397 RepID=UPI00143D6371|nr:glycosyltransferase family 2 protein [Rhodophyticola sp. CCM32]
MRVASITPAKDEGPFILEWVAYHRLIGVTDILIFSNDCTDGSDLLLDRLDEMGLIRHYANPSMIMEMERHHLAVIKYSNTLSRLKRVDWIVSLDMDEFICVNTGEGRLADLFSACDGADVISINQLNFGCAGRRDFTEELQMNRFDQCQFYEGSRNPRNPRRGVKSFTRVGAPVDRITNHSPRPIEGRGDELRWVNAANQPLPDDLKIREIKSLEEGVFSYDLAQLNHYALRSMDSFLTQVARGNANHADRSADLSYWRRYNINDQQDHRITRWSDRVAETMAEMLEDAELADLHAACVAAHRTKIGVLYENDDFVDLRRRIEGAHRRGWEQTPDAT